MSDTDCLLINSMEKEDDALGRLPRSHPRSAVASLAGKHDAGGDCEGGVGAATDREIKDLPLADRFCSYCAFELAGHSSKEQAPCPAEAGAISRGV
jgi:hypothetical protein